MTTQPAGAWKARRSGCRVGSLFLGSGFFNPEGKQLAAGKKFAKIESGKWLGKVYAPVDGELVESNEELEDNATIINEDCYGKGWMFKIKPDDKGELDQLIRRPEAIEKWLLADIEKYSQET